MPKNLFFTMVNAQQHGFTMVNAQQHSFTMVLHKNNLVLENYMPKEFYHGKCPSRNEQILKI